MANKQHNTALFCSGMCFGVGMLSLFIWVGGPHQAPLAGTVIFLVAGAAWSYLAGRSS